MADNYVLRVTAGPRYDLNTHQVVNVNTPETLHISSETADVDLNVRIQVSALIPLYPCLQRDLLATDELTGF